MEKILLSWSGGKDSALALHRLRKDRAVRVVGLLTTVTEKYERISMHGVRRELLEQQARSIGLPLHEVSIPPQGTGEIYDRRMAEVLTGQKNKGVTAVAFGDLFLEDVRAYRETRLAEIELAARFPLWGLETAKLAREFIGLGFRAIVTCCDTKQVDGGFSGRSFDENLLNDLPPSADPCAENGEFHSFVYDGPIFKEQIPIKVGQKILRDERFMFCDLVAG